MAALPGGPGALRRLWLPALFVVGLFVALWWRQPEGPQGDGIWSWQGQSMGTTWSVKAVPPAAGAGREALGAVITEALADVNHKMSTYMPESELSRFNQNPSVAPVPIGEDLVTVLREALRLSARSGGAFDVTVGPLVNAWGFGPTDMGAPPTEAALAELRPRVGYQKLHLDEGARTLRKEHAQMYVDLSAIAKGFGVDQVARALERQGVSSYFVEVGGEVRAKGRKPDGGRWRVGIEKPDAEARGVQEVVELDGLSMATSGNYRNFYEKDGKRLSHTINPQTGAPVEHRLASVSVVHPECMVADGWATALNVLGEEEGFALALREGLPVLMLVKTPAGAFVEKATPAFEELRAATRGGGR
jgi:thiamine biosynthesis lipoprotein